MKNSRWNSRTITSKFNRKLLIHKWGTPKFLVRIQLLFLANMVVQFPTCRRFTAVSRISTGSAQIQIVSLFIIKTGSRQTSGRISINMKCVMLGLVKIMEKSSHFCSHTGPDEPAASGTLTPGLSPVTKIAFTQSRSFLSLRLNKNDDSTVQLPWFKDKANDCNGPLGKSILCIIEIRHCYQSSHIMQSRICSLDIRCCINVIILLLWFYLLMEAMDNGIFTVFFIKYLMF